jgi:hypothetical protein
MIFDISMAVRRGDTRLLAELEDILVRREAEIRALLDEYGVPQIRTGREGLEAERRVDAT